MDRDDAYQVIVDAIFLMAVKNVMFIQFVAIDGAFAVGGIHAEPDAVNFLDIIVGRPSKFGFLL